MKYILVLLSIFFITACSPEEEREERIDAKYLVENDCKYTGESFINEETIMVGPARFSRPEVVEKRYYVYKCSQEQKVLATVRFEIEKE